MDHIGIDVDRKESQICIVAERNELLERRVRTEPRRFAETLGAPCRMKIVHPFSVTAGLAPAIVRRSCQSLLEWSNCSGRMVGDPKIIQDMGHETQLAAVAEALAGFVPAVQPWALTWPGSARTGRRRPTREPPSSPGAGRPRRNCPVRLSSYGGTADVP